jgi:hypothetical protein
MHDGQAVATSPVRTEDRGEAGRQVFQIRKHIG